MSDHPGRLILGRRVGESIKINDDITITINEIHGGLVRLSIVAPKSIRVHRQEVWERIQEENESAERRHNSV